MKALQARWSLLQPPTPAVVNRKQPQMIHKQAVVNRKQPQMIHKQMRVAIS